MASALDLEYLENTVSIPLADAIARASIDQPADPIEYISEYLLHGLAIAERKKKRDADASQLEVEREAERQRLERLRILREEEERRAREERAKRLASQAETISKANLEASNTFLATVEDRKKQYRRELIRQVAFEIRDSGEEVEEPEEEPEEKEEAEEEAEKEDGEENEGDDGEYDDELHEEDEEDKGPVVDEDGLSKGMWLAAEERVEIDAMEEAVHLHSLMVDEDLTGEVVESLLRDVCYQPYLPAEGEGAVLRTEATSKDAHRVLKAVFLALGHPIAQVSGWSLLTDKIQDVTFNHRLAQFDAGSEQSPFKFVRAAAATAAIDKSQWADGSAHGMVVLCHWLDTTMAMFSAAHGVRVEDREANGEEPMAGDEEGLVLKMWSSELPEGCPIETPIISPETPRTLDQVAGNGEETTEESGEADGGEDDEKADEGAEEEESPVELTEEEKLEAHAALLADNIPAPERLVEMPEDYDDDVAFYIEVGDYNESDTDY